MSECPSLQTAKIIPFPIRSRTSAIAKAELKAPATVAVSGWYHESAIDESRKTSER